MSSLSLPSSLIDKVHAQIELWHSKAAETDTEYSEDQALPFITISRQFGCQSFVLAETLAEKLNAEPPKREFLVYDRKLLSHISESELAYANLIKNLTEKKKSELEDWVVQLFSGVPSEMKVYNHLSETICALVSGGYSIIIGRGSAVMSRYLEGGIHVRLTAPIEWRLETLKNNPKFTENIDIDILRKHDEEREGFVKKYLGVDINSPEHFDMTFNNSKMNPNEMAEMVEQLLKIRCPQF